MNSSEFPYAIARYSCPTEGEHNALVPWWSITKTVLAVAALHLAEKGSFNLDDRYEDWPFTVRQLLQHTSGLGNYGGPIYQQAVANGEAVWSIDELLERRNARNLLFAPGEDWAYSNIGYLFIRQIIEHATGSDIDEALDSLIFIPMQMKSARIAKTPRDMADTLWGNSTNYDPRWVYHGLVIGSPRDAVEFLIRLLEDEFLSEQTLPAMQNKYVLGDVVPNRPWEKIGYGLGVMIGRMKDAGRVIGHSGVGHDTVSALYAFLDLPDRPIVSVFAQGTDEGVVEYEAVRLARSK